jgi:hypothetical protein
LKSYWVIEYLPLYVLWILLWRFYRWIFVFATRISTVAHYENFDIVTRKCQQKIMKVYFQTWRPFEILLGNGIFAPLSIMETLLKVLKWNFRLGNVDFDRGTLRKYWNRNTKMSPKNDEKRFSNMNNFWNPIG